MPVTARAYLDAVRKRCDEATPEPWLNGPDDYAVEAAAEDAFLRCVAVTDHCGDAPSLNDEKKANANFIAHARTDLTKLERIARLALDYRWSLDAESTATHSERIAVREALFAALEELK